MGFNQKINDSMNNMSRSVTTQMMKDAPPDLTYVYIGAIDEKTRPFCLDAASQGALTEAQILELGGEYAESLVSGGGINCRHNWELASDDIQSQFHRGGEAQKILGAKADKPIDILAVNSAGKHKTIQDAEQWAKANSVNENQPLEILGSRRFGVNNVGFNYKDLDIVDANKVNIAIKNFNNVCDKLKIPRIEGFASAHPLMPSIADAAMGDSNLFVKKIVFKKGERDLKLFGKSVGKIDYSQQAIWHEFGHHIHHNLGVTLKNMSAKNPNMTNLGWKKLTPLERKIEKAYKEVQKAGVSTENFFPTTYSTANSVEWFAECFTYWKNKKGKMPDSFLKLIKEEGISDAITR